MCKRLLRFCLDCASDSPSIHICFWFVVFGFVCVLCLALLCKYICLYNSLNTVEIVWGGGGTVLYRTGADSEASHHQKSDHFIV